MAKMHVCGQNLLWLMASTIWAKARSLSATWAAGVGQFVLVVRVTREMPGQNSAHFLDRVQNGFSEPGLFEQFSHSGADLLPESVAALFVDALIAHDGELACARDEVNQDRVAMPGAGHAHLQKALLRERKWVGPLATRNINPYFAGALAFGLGDRVDDFSFVQLTDKFLRIHAASPTPARASSTR